MSWTKWRARRGGRSRQERIAGATCPGCQRCHTIWLARMLKPSIHRFEHRLTLALLNQTARLPVISIKVGGKKSQDCSPRRSRSVFKSNLRLGRVVNVFTFNSYPFHSKRISDFSSPPIPLTHTTPSTMADKQTQDDAARTRIINHMNADHHDSVSPIPKQQSFQVQ